MATQNERPIIPAGTDRAGAAVPSNGGTRPGLDHPPAASPPVGITGDKLTIRLDWWNSTHPISMLETIRGWIERTLGESQICERGAPHFPSGSYRWPSGAILAWNDQTNRCWVSINGDSLDLLGHEAWWLMVRELVHTFAGQCTRADIAADFTRDVLSLDDVYQAATNGDFAGYQCCDPRSPLKRQGGRMVAEGHQVNFGRRGKDGKGAFVRVYDKGLESGGEIDRVRVEVEFSGDLAKGSTDGLQLRPGVGEMLAGTETPEKFVRQMARLVSGAIDFVDRSNAHGHRDRMERLAWWQRCVDLLADPIRLVATRFKPTAERSLAWIKSQVAPTLAYVAVCVETAGHEFRDLLESIMEHGRQRMRWGRMHESDLSFDPRRAFPDLPVLSHS